MASPAFGTTGGDVASWFAHYGPQRAKEILQRLKDNEVRLVSGNSTAVRMVATGQADICFTDTDDIYAGQRNGWPVAMNFLDQNGEGVLAIPNTAAMIKGGPHPEAAAKLMHFLLSEELERLLVESDSHNSPVHAPVAQKYPQYAIPHPLNLDYGRVADFLPEAIEIGAGDSRVSSGAAPTRFVKAAGLVLVAVGRSRCRCWLWRLRLYRRSHSRTLPGLCSPPCCARAVLAGIIAGGCRRVGLAAGPTARDSAARTAALFCCSFCCRWSCRSTCSTTPGRCC